MPFGLRWPFGRKKAANQAHSPAASNEPVSVQRTPATEAPSAVSEPRTFELGAEVLGRASGLGALPTLGADAGLNIAQNVGEAGRFMQRLPNSENLITASDLPDTSDFVASLASLSSFTNLESTPVLMGELIPPSGLTDELPPPGSLPNQLAGLMGVAPVTPDANAGAIDVMPAPTSPPLQAVEPIEAATPRESVSPLATVTALSETTAALIGERPFETIVPFNPEQPLVAPIAPSVSEVPAPIPASFVVPAPMSESGRDIVETSGPVESSAMFGAPRVPALALNNFAEALPLINLPGEASDVESPALSITPEAAPAFDLPIKTGDFDLPLTLPELAQATGPSVSESAAPSESAASSTPLSISRYAEDLPLPAPIAPREEAPSALNVPSVELPMVAPLPPLNVPEEMPAPFEPLSLSEVARDLATQPLLSDEPLVDQLPIDQLPVAQSATDQPSSNGEPALSISRYAEDMPLIDLDFGWSEFEPPPIEPSFTDATSMPTEVLPPLATTTPAMALPSIGERADRAATRSERAPMSISRFSNDLPLNRSTTLNQVTQIQRFSLGSLTQNLPSLGGVTDNLPSLGGLAQNIPSLGGMAENLPSLGGLTDNLPSLGGLAESIGGQLPQMPSLGGLASSQMPLPPSISDAIGGLSSAGQEALGQITSMAPSMPEMPAMPQMPSIEKLTDQVWREIQKKLKVERERTRGLA